MTFADFATAGFIDTWFRAILARLEQQGAARAPAPADVVLYSIPKLAAVLDVHPETVRAWLSTGKKGKDGSQLKLQAYRFTSEARIPWPALLAYERGEAFDLATLPAPLLLPPKELEPAPLPTLTTPTKPAVLRVA
jgi:hypothetical protein